MTGENKKLKKLRTDVEKHIVALSKLMHEASVGNVYALQMTMLVDTDKNQVPHLIATTNGIPAMLGLAFEVSSEIRRQMLSAEDEKFVKENKHIVLEHLTLANAKQLHDVNAGASESG